MENQERKLGRGLSALIGESKVKHKILQREEPSPENISLIKLSRIKAGEYQPRQTFKEDKLQELSDSIKENGVLQPIILRSIGEDGQYEIIAGERRFRASKKAGLTEIPAIIKRLNNHQALELAIVENIQRSDLTVIEEARSYQKLMQEFSYTQEQVAQKVGKSRSHVANNLRLLGLPKNVQDLLNEDTITMGHARAIINADDQEGLIREILKNKLSVRDTEELAREQKLEKNTAGHLPLMIRTESAIKYINKEHLSSFEETIYVNTGLKTKISYNSALNKGKIVLKFDDINDLDKFAKQVEK